MDIGHVITILHFVDPCVDITQTTHTQNADTHNVQCLRFDIDDETFRLLFQIMRVELRWRNARALARRLFLSVMLLSVAIFVALNGRYGIMVSLLPVTDYEYYLAFISPTTSNHQALETQKTVIAYVVSITSCNTRVFQRRKLYDNAAVLHQSIKLASQKSSKYDYKMIAFVHTEATNCANGMKKLGYEVQVRETPFNETEIRNPVLIKVQDNGCCGSKEYLKLYAYTLLEYPVVVHIDLDTIVLKAMDPMFDLMLDPSFNRSKTPAMWLPPDEFPETIDFLYTRDYNMVDPPKRLPHQIGVQGGFLVIRPNMTDFDRMVEIILSGGYFVAGAGWGGRTLRYGGYFGAGTIQGLASYYYGEFAKHRSLELNRCYYNTMVDDPKNTRQVLNNPKVQHRCRTLEEECQDCRKTPLNEVYNAHFTICGKPDYCSTPKEWWLPGMEDHHSLCMELFRQWHLARRSLEEEWQRKYPIIYDPNLVRWNLSIAEEAYMFNYTQGHCQARRYIPMEYPAGFMNDSADLPILIE